MSQLYDLPDPKKVEQETYREFLRDGLTEVFAGFMLILTIGMIRGTFLMPIYIIFALIILPKAMEKIRELYTYPRLGYVKFKVEGDGNKRSFIIFLITVITLMIAAFFLLVEDRTNTDNIYKLVPLFFGLVMIGPSSYLVEKSGLKRYWSFAVVSIVLGLTMSLITTDNPEYERFDGISIMLTGIGTFLIIFGGIMFKIFLDRPVLEEEPDE